MAHLNCTDCSDSVYRQESAADDSCITVSGIIGTVLKFGETCLVAGALPGPHSQHSPRLPSWWRRSWLPIPRTLPPHLAQLFGS